MRLLHYAPHRAHNTHKLLFMTLRPALFASVILLLSACASPSKTAEMNQLLRDQNQLLQLQTIRLTMHEEYLAQLAEVQMELEDSVARVDERTNFVERAIYRYLAEQEQTSPADREPILDHVDATPAPDKVVVGRNEWIWLDLLNRNLKARIDTGALSSSLNAIDIQPFERDGQDWVRFRVPDEEHPEGGDVYEAPLVRNVRIRQASADEVDRRPVIRLRVRMGDYVDDAEFNLSNRENMLYPVLLGRNFLRDIMVVDVAQKFTQGRYEPETPEVKAP